MLAEKREKRREKSGGREHPHPILRHKAKVGADTIRPKEEAQQPVGEGLCALPVVRHKA